MRFAIIQVLPYLNNPKDLDPYYKMDLDFWHCFGWKKILSFNRRNTEVMYVLFSLLYNGS